MEPVQLVDPDGQLTLDRRYPVEVNAELCQDFYRKMRLARRLDDEALALQRQGELGLWLQVRGQEAAQIGSVAALCPTDYVFPSYREHAAALARGITPAEMLVQWRGNTNSGWDPAKYRFHINTLVLAAQLLHAVGYAMGVQRDGADEVVAAYFGDGASSEGDANESFNWAAAFSLPLLFFCQNNHWAISTPTNRQMRRSLTDRAEGFGLDGYAVDGNDVLAVYAVTKHAAEAIRAGGGPAFVEALTYRMAGHSTSDDPSRYRTEAEVESWEQRDPIHRLELLMEKSGWLPDDVRTDIDAECESLGKQTREACLAMRPPDPMTMFENVLTKPTSHLTEQRNNYQKLLDSFE